MRDSHFRRTAPTDAMAVGQHLPWESSCIIKEVCEQLQGVRGVLQVLCCCRNEACEPGHVYVGRQSLAQEDNLLAKLQDQLCSS